MRVQRCQVAPSLDQKNSVMILLRQQHLELLAAVLGTGTLRVPFDEVDELVVVLGLHLEFETIMMQLISIPSWINPRHHRRSAEA